MPLYVTSDVAALFQQRPASLPALLACTTLSLTISSTTQTLSEVLGRLSAPGILTTLRIKTPELLFDADDVLCKELPEWLGNLPALETVLVRGCVNLMKLPDELGQLSSLTTLTVECRTLTALTDTLGQLEKLENLTLTWCVNLTHLPTSLGQLKALTKLHLTECRALTELPDSLGQLTALVTLDLLDCSVVTRLPESVGQLTALIALNLSFCHALKRLPKSLGQLTALTFLDLSHCYVLTGLPESLGELAALTALNVSHCHAVTGLPKTLGDLSALKTLNISWCSVTELPQSIGRLTALTDMIMCGCADLDRLPISFAFLSDNIRMSWNQYVMFPPEHICQDGMQAVKAFLFAHDHPCKILAIILFAVRQSGNSCLPAEVWISILHAISHDQYNYLPQLQLPQTKVVQHDFQLEQQPLLN